MEVATNGLCVIKLNGSTNDVVVTDGFTTRTITPQLNGTVIEFWQHRYTVPSISPNGVVSAASFTSPVSPGSLASIFGQNLGPATPVAAASLPLPTNLGGVQVLVNGVAAPLVYVSGGQINFQLPSEPFLGYPYKEPIQVCYNGLCGNTATVPFVDAAPALFVSNGSAIITDASGQLNPVTAGQSYTGWATGLGATSCNLPAGTPAPNDGTLCRAVITPTLEIGGQQAQISFAGLAPGFPGLYQINFELPGSPTNSGQAQTVAGALSAQGVSTPFQMQVLGALQ